MDHSSPVQEVIYGLNQTEAVGISWLQTPADICLQTPRMRAASSRSSLLITDLPWNEQRAELSLQTRDVSMLITWHYLAATCTHHRGFSCCQHHFGAPGLSFALPLTHTDGLLSAPASSCLDWPLTRSPAACLELKNDSLSLSLSHCYWGWTGRPKPMKVRSPQGEGHSLHHHTPGAPPEPVFPEGGKMFLSYLE